MVFDFDEVIDRRDTASVKWKRYDEDVLPLWVADMDFRSPEPVIDSLRNVLTHGILGYEFPSKKLNLVVAQRMEKLYGWKVSPEWVVATPGVVAGFLAASRSLCTPGQGILVQPPVYPPFIHVHESCGLIRQDAPLATMVKDGILTYQVDHDIFKAAAHAEGVKTGMFLLCNPHNPTGQVYSRSDLQAMADVCLDNNIAICSDEIHSELLLGATDGQSQPSSHIPIAALSPEIEKNSITLVAPSKTFNVPGLFCGFAIIPNEEMLNKYKIALDHMAMHVNSLGLVAAQAAFSGDCDEWLAALLGYLTRNRDFLVDRIRNDFHGISMTNPQATSLAWLDCNDLITSEQIEGSPQEFFLSKARVALNEGSDFGPGGNGFVRLNFGCPRQTLTDALDRMKHALPA